MKLIKPAFLLILLLYVSQLFAQTESRKEAVFFCIDHSGKTLHYSTGKAVVKKGLDQKEFYQYGFLKWKGWINKSWETLDYDLKFLSGTSNKRTPTYLDPLIRTYRAKGYTIEKVPMPYPMKPFVGYKKDGTN